jgi:hypothetical protein
MERVVKRLREFDVTVSPSKILQVDGQAYRTSTENLCGVFISGISEKVAISKLKNELKGLEVLIPKFKDSHIGLAYALFNATDQRDTQIQKIFKSSSKLTKIGFDESMEMSMTESIQSFSEILSSLRDLTQEIYNFELVISNSQPRNIPEIICNSHQTANRILAYNYKSIKSAINIIESPRNPVKSIETSLEDLKWYLLFVLCWFILEIQTIKDIKNFRYFFMGFINSNFMLFIQHLDDCDPIIRLFILDTVFQLLIQKNQFVLESRVLESIINTTWVPNLIKFSISYPEKSVLFKEILLQKLIQAKLNLIPSVDYPAFIREIISKIYFLDLPETIHSIILPNHAILINYCSKYENTKVYWGCTLLFVIRSLWNLSKRLPIHTDQQWFECGTQTKCQIIENEPSFDIDLYGETLTYLTDKASDFLLNPYNWQLNSKEFKKNLRPLNQWDHKQILKESQIKIFLTKEEYIQKFGDPKPKTKKKKIGNGRIKLNNKKK